MTYPFVRARHYYLGRNRPIRLFVAHTAEVAEGPTAAEGVANYFATTDKKVSAHLVGDEDSVIQCVEFADTAFAAPGANADGIQYELCGRASQDPTQWTDEPSTKAIGLMAIAARDVCKQYDLPIRHLTNEQLAAGEKGIVGHVQVAQVYKLSTHYDPGVNFPWSRLIQLATGPTKEDEDMFWILQAAEGQGGYGVGQYVVAADLSRGWKLDNQSQRDEVLGKFGARFLGDKQVHHTILTKILARA